MRGLIVCGLTVVTLATGCSTVTKQVSSAPPPAPVPAKPPKVIVFIADGAGNFQGASHAIRAAVQNCGAPLHVHTFEWSHGNKRILADHLDGRFARAQGKRLAAEIRAYQEKAGANALPVSILGHSAGSLVALSAAEDLPPNSVESIVLLAPSVSADYDLRRALRSVRGGVEVFHSRKDNGYLGFVVGILGTSDNRRSLAAGRYGFRHPQPGTPGSELFAKLHQHPWDETVQWTGNEGGHYGGYQEGYVKAYVLPTMLPEQPRAPASEDRPFAGARGW